jgi:hypothetical protein
VKQITQSLSDLPYTLVLNVRYADEHGEPVHSERCDEHIETLNAWQSQAREQEEPVPVPSLVFRGANLLMHPHGAGKGQWRWLLTSNLLTVCLSRGRLNGILAQVRFSARLLWSAETDTHAQDLWAVIEEVEAFLTSLLRTSVHPCVHLQVSEVHLCADIAGWDVAHCSDWQATMLTRARRRRPYGSYTPPEPDDCQQHGCPAGGAGS